MRALFPQIVFCPTKLSNNSLLLNTNLRNLGQSEDPIPTNCIISRPLTLQKKVDWGKEGKEENFLFMEKFEGNADQSPFPTRSPLKTENGGAHHTKNPERKETTSFASRIWEHVRIGQTFSETVKGKMSIGAKIIKKGGRENIFRDTFGFSNGEKLLKASQCYLSTTAGPIAGILFITTEKVAFCSERPITVESSGGLFRTPYKLSVPMKMIKGAFEAKNLNNASHKYIEIVTQDNFELWFMGFVRYEKALAKLQIAISLCR